MSFFAWYFIAILNQLSSLFTSLRNWFSSSNSFFLTVSTIKFKKFSCFEVPPNQSKLFLIDNCQWLLHFQINLLPIVALPNFFIRTFHEHILFLFLIFELFNCNLQFKWLNCAVNSMSAWYVTPLHFYISRRARFKISLIDRCMSHVNSRQ